MLQNCCFLHASKMYNCTIKTFLHDPSEFHTMRRYRWEKYKMMSLFHRNVQQRFVGQILLSKGHELRIYVKIGLYQLLFLLWCLMMDLTNATSKYHHCFKNINLKVSRKISIWIWNVIKNIYLHWPIEIYLLYIFQKPQNRIHKQNNNCYIVLFGIKMGNYKLKEYVLKDNKVCTIRLVYI